LRRTLALLGLAFLCVAVPAASQESPAPAPAGPDALAVRLRVSFMAAEVEGIPASKEPIQSENVKFTPPGSPVSFKLVWPNMIVFMKVTPFPRKDDSSGVTLIAEGQVGMQRADGGFSYQATVSTIAVKYGEPVLFLPAGLRSPLRIEIFVLRQADLSGQGAAPEAATPQKTGR